MNRLMMIIDGEPGGDYLQTSSILLTGEGLDAVFCVLARTQDPQDVVDALKELADAILDRVNEQPDTEAEEREFLADEAMDILTPSSAYL